ncbi:uncharacterized serine-rich protein C215.13 [Sesamum indicum]|uniref:Uncharacterized serine-rich protein C215.13 n=1 Tax=Sesamum indicum TaxID=4182 RepID=A0A6I9SKS8_SESIN|nr:uncharacterized serine-rich protein C215.13 [Sesamum indicum]
MGSCISKCRPKKKFKEEDESHVHDKLVISQDPMISSNLATVVMPSEKPLSPAPSSSSSSSISAFSCSSHRKCAGTMASSVSSSLSLSSCSSSVVSAKDRSFSNDFLRACVKENPQIIGLNSVIKEKTVDKPIVNASKVHPRWNLDPSPLLNASPIVQKAKQSVQERPMISVPTPKKRARASSPTLVRQKSFRKDQNPASSLPNRGLRSPSPSRRFSGENSRSSSTNGTYESSGRSPVTHKANAISSATSGVKRESFRAPITASPSRDMMISRNLPVRKKGTFSQQVSKKIDEGVATADVGEMDTVMEDINNPLIALDCFIFL